MARLMQSRNPSHLFPVPTPSQTLKPSGRSTGFGTRLLERLILPSWIHPSPKRTSLTCSHTQAEQGCMLVTQVNFCLCAYS